MSSTGRNSFSSSWIESLRGKKNHVDASRPYAWLVETERTHRGTVEDTGIIFITNRECHYRCLMCDLWKNTTNESVLPGAIPDQIAWALERMPGVKHLKLYNSGSFFDEQAIPLSDYVKIASLVSCMETVIVECHPGLVGEKCLKFRDMLKPDLHIAMGLETVNRVVLNQLNKKMTPEDFEGSVHYLSENGILSRAFILLRPPFMTESEGIYWAERSIDFAFKTGIECCIVIPVRGGNGAMEELMKAGHFNIPEIASLEKVLEYGIRLGKGRVFADTWDIGLFSRCNKCLDSRTERLKVMNLTQMVINPVGCECSKR